MVCLLSLLALGGVALPGYAAFMASAKYNRDRATQLVVLLKGCAYGNAGTKVRVSIPECERLCKAGMAKVFEWQDQIVRKGSKCQPK